MRSLDRVKRTTMCGYADVQMCELGIHPQIRTFAHSHIMILSIIIVNYNVKYFLEQCLCSVKKALEAAMLLPGPGAEVLVIDNHSTDGSVEYLRPKFGFTSQAGISIQDILYTVAVSEILDYEPCHNTRPFHARLAVTDFWVNADAV